MMSCLTLMPVISANALASVFDSYMCVSSVSDTTCISLTPCDFSFAAVSMNHFISSICCCFDSVLGWNSLSTHFCASAAPAIAAWLVKPIATTPATASVTIRLLCCMAVSSVSTPLGSTAGVRPGH